MVSQNLFVFFDNIALVIKCINVSLPDVTIAAVNYTRIFYYIIRSSPYIVTTNLMSY